MTVSKKMAVVTGAAGFIGSHMVDLLLERGFRVHGVDNLTGGRLENLSRHKANPDFVLEQKDIRRLLPDEPFFRQAQAVFHFAGIADIVPSIEKPIDYMSTNVMGTVHCLEAARHAGVQKFVYAASSSCYGIPTELPTPEEAAIQPQYPYALSKYLGEQAVLHWGKTYRLPVNSIRIFNAYGPRVRTTGVYGAVFGVFLRQKLAGMPFTVVGDGTQTRDFIYVTDLVRAFLLAGLTEHSGEIFNVGTGHPQSINRLVELLQGTVIHIPKRPGEPDCTWAEPAKIKRLLRWEPEVSFEQGVRTMLDHIGDWKDAPIWTPEKISEATRDWFQYLSR